MASAPKIPAVPSAAETAAAQTTSNLKTLHATQAAQNVNQETPYGSLNFNITGTDPEGNPLYTSTSQLSPEQQSLLNILQGSQTGLGGQGSGLVSNVDYSQAPDFSEAAGTQTRANMDRYVQYMQPTYTQQKEQLDNQLRNQGLTPGTQAYDRAERTLELNQNQSTASALNQYQQNAFSQAQTQYNQPLQTLQSIFGLTSPASLPNQFVNTPKPTMNATDVVGATSAANQANQQAYQMQAQKYNSTLQGLFGLGSTALSFV